MASNYTTNYNLCQWEPTDQVKRTDFNEDNAKIDAALKTLSDGKADQAAISTLNTAIAQKADQSAVQSLNSRVSSLESRTLRIATGTYAGTGNKGSLYPNTLNFASSLGRAPMLVIVRPLSESSDGLVLISGMTVSANNMSGSYGSSTTIYVSWSGMSVSWYSDYGSMTQMNQSGVSYCYFAIG